MRVIERIWRGDDVASRLAAAALAPLGWSFSAIVAARNALYDHGLARALDGGIPALSVGNLSVGGTGKTPVAAWAAARLAESGARPAIVMRGYGRDEPLVHARLNPAIPVIADADRVRGISAARAAGADCAILDDAFQHRRARRVADWVLVGAEQWRDGQRLLPAGPMREPVGSLARARVVVVTRKTDSIESAERLARALAAHVPGGAWAVCHLAPHGLVDVATGAERPLDWLPGRRVLAVAAIGAPGLFFDQLRALGADITPVALPDHHAFAGPEAQALASRGAAFDAVVCTLKDAVKLGPLWPRAAPAPWYVSQHAVVERGRPALEATIDAVLAARTASQPTPGSADPSHSAHGHRSSTADR